MAVERDFGKTDAFPSPRKLQTFYRCYFQNSPNNQNLNSANLKNTVLSRAFHALHRIVWLCQIFWWRNYTFSLKTLFSF